MKKLLTKEQHYVPQFYLKGFSEDGIHIYQYDIKKDKVHKTLIKNTCKESYLYEYKNESGKIISNNEIETVFCEIESSVADLLKELSNKSDSNNHSEFLTDYELLILYIYLYVQLMRTRKNLLLAIENINYNENEYLNKNKILDVLFKDIDFISNDFLLKTIDMLRRLKPVVIRTTFNAFYTTDNPVFISYKNTKKHGIKLNLVKFTLSSNMALVLTDQKDKCIKNQLFIYDADHPNIDLVNIDVFRTADRYVYSKEPFSEYQIEQIKKYHRKNN